MTGGTPATPAPVPSAELWGDPPTHDPEPARGEGSLRGPAAGAPRAWTLGERADARIGVAGALGLAALGDVLLRGGPLGINLVLWTAAALTALLAFARRRGRPVTVAATLLAALALAFAACVAWRDAAALVGLALLGLVTSAAALARALRDGAAWAIEHAEAGAYAAGAWSVARDMTAGPRAMGMDRASLREWPTSEAAARAGIVSLRGALLAAPVLAVFGLLLAAADGTFAALVGRLLDLDLAALGGHALWTAAGAWALAGYAAGALFARPAPDERAAGSTGVARCGRLGAGEVVVAIALVDALLLVFVAVQAARLVGGPTAGGAVGSYAEMARRGFFELAAVAGLSLPLLVAAASVVGRAAPRDAARRAFRVAAGVLLALLGALLLSAADRMRLYEAAYGLTELRLYVLAFLAWLAATFAWAACTLLRGRASAFALGATVLAWGAVFALHAIDPAALVVRVNAGRAVTGAFTSPAGADQRFDVAYLASLGADAVPELVARVLPRMTGPATACGDAAALDGALARAARSRSGWRSWNLARHRAAAGARAAFDSGRVPSVRATCTRERDPAAGAERR